MDLDMMRTVARMMSPEQSIRIVKKLIQEYEETKDESKYEEFQRSCLMVGIKMLDEVTDSNNVKITTCTMSDKHTPGTRTVPEAICPHCFKKHEEKHISSNSPKIEEGDFSFCPVCFEVSAFDHNMKLRKMSADEVTHLYHNIGSEIDACRRMIESASKGSRQIDGQFIFKDMTKKHFDDNKD